VQEDKAPSHAHFAQDVVFSLHKVEQLLKLSSRCQSLHVRSIAIYIGSITFGPQLTWPLRALERANGTRVVHHQPGSANSDSLGNNTVIRYDAFVSGNDSTDSISNCLLANFFYIELINQPCFASGPEICLLRLRCRGQFSNILRKFRQSRIYFRGNEPNYYISYLLAPDALQCSDYGEEFGRIIEVMVSSPASKISVKIEGPDGQTRHISGSPYPLGQLIRDQGLYCLFGNSNHSTICDSVSVEENKTTMRLHAKKLQNTLKSINAMNQERPKESRISLQGPPYRYRQAVSTDAENRRCHKVNGERYANIRFLFH
jgi:hypothetical protein